MQLLKEQLGEIQKNLSRTEQKASQALELGKSLQEESHYLKQQLSDLKDKTVIMESAFKSSRLKFKGLPEGSENSQNLAFFEKLAGADNGVRRGNLPNNS